jgi:hypothetical protein
MTLKVYVVQPFSRDGSGALVRDTPVWSRDRGFAAALLRSLAKRKAGVMVLEVALDPTGELHAEGEIIGSHGTVPVALVLEHLQPKHRESIEGGEAPITRRA